MTFKLKIPIIQEIVDQHAEEVPFLWLQRDRAVCEPHYKLDDLVKLDNRIEAHIDGLRIAGVEGWEICRQVLRIEPSEIFTASVLAFESKNEVQINKVLEVASTSYELSRGIISALGWISYLKIKNLVKQLLHSDDPYYQHISLAASAIHRVDPGQPLLDALNNNNILLRERALRAVAELGRIDILHSSQKELMAEDEDCRFVACWSAALFGNMNAVAVLKSFVGSKKYQEKALQVALRQMNLQTAEKFLKELFKKPEYVRIATQGIGIIGNPTTVSLLIDLMSIAELARVAGESFSMITGVDIAYEDLEGEWPEGFEAGPTENPEDEDVEMDPDEDLPWPEPELIKRWWKEHESDFKKGERYLCGKPMTIEHLQYVLRYGYQRQRNAAALELAIRQPGTPLFETRAPGFRQQKLLKLK